MRALLLVLLAAAACSGGERAALPVVTVRRQPFARIIEADGYLRPLRATPVTTPSNIDWTPRITWLAPDGSVVKKGEPLVRFDDQELRQKLASAQSEVTVAEARRGKEQAILRAADHDCARTIEGARRELELTRQFQRRDATIFSRDQMIEGEIDRDLLETRVAHARDGQRLDRQLAQRRLGIIAVEDGKAKANIRRSREGLSSLEITAPHDGVFTLRRRWNGETARVGDSLFRSMSVAEVSLLDPMEVEVFVLEAEAAGLAVGRRAEVTVEARQGQPFAATIRQVEAVARRRQQESPTQYFGVVLKLERTDPALMKPGQRVRARLFLHEQQALVVPRPALFDRDGKWLVFRRGPGGGFTAVTVTLGHSTAGQATIESGLQEGDVLALRDPGKAADELLRGPAREAPASQR